MVLEWCIPEVSSKSDRPFPSVGDVKVVIRAKWLFRVWAVLKSLNRYENSRQISFQPT
jgi:hypothetical protein